VQIPNAQKKADGLTVLFALLGSAGVKAARKMLVKLTRGQWQSFDLESVNNTKSSLTYTRAYPLAGFNNSSSFSNCKQSDTR